MYCTRQPRGTAAAPARLRAALVGQRRVEDPGVCPLAALSARLAALCVVLTLSVADEVQLFHLAAAAEDGEQPRRRAQAGSGSRRRALLRAHPGRGAVAGVGDVAEPPAELFGVGWSGGSSSGGSGGATIARCALVLAGLGCGGGGGTTLDAQLSRRVPVAQRVVSAAAATRLQAVIWRAALAQRPLIRGLAVQHKAVEILIPRGLLLHLHCAAWMLLLLLPCCRAARRRGQRLLHKPALQALQQVRLHLGFAGGERGQAACHSVAVQARQQWQRCSVKGESGLSATAAQPSGTRRTDRSCACRGALQLKPHPASGWARHLALHCPLVSCHHFPAGKHRSTRAARQMRRLRQVARWAAGTHLRAARPVQVPQNARAEPLGVPLLIRSGQLGFAGLASARAPRASLLHTNMARFQCNPIRAGAPALLRSEEGHWVAARWLRAIACSSWLPTRNVQSINARRYEQKCNTGSCRPMNPAVPTPAPLQMKTLASTVI